MTLTIAYFPWLPYAVLDWGMSQRRQSDAIDTHTLQDLWQTNASDAVIAVLVQYVCTSK